MGLSLLICLVSLAESFRINGACFVAPQGAAQLHLRGRQGISEALARQGGRAGRAGPSVCMMAKKPRQGKASFVASLPAGAERPSLVVFDLDNTLWTPELYQLRRTPKADKDIYLFEGAKAAMKELATEKAWAKSEFALASRTNQGEWAFNLLTRFVVDEESGKTMDELFKYKQIFTGTKRKHFDKLKQETGIKYEDMIFFDDSTMNTVEVERMGVLCVYCPRGLTSEIWQNGLSEYAKMKEERVPFMGRTLSVPSQGASESATVTVPTEGVGKLIGKQGIKIKSLQAETGASIKVDRRPSTTHETIVTIQGTPDAVGDAKKAIARICG